MWRHKRNSHQPSAAAVATGFLCLFLTLPAVARGQSCQTSADFDLPTRTAIEAAAHKYFDLAAKGDVTALQQSSIPSVAGAFSGIASAVQENQAAFARAQSAIRSSFQLTAEGNAPLERAEFLCGVFGKNGQSATSAMFVLNGLPPGRYAVIILDVTGGSIPYGVAFVLQQIGTDWRLGGFYAKAAQSAGHDSAWFSERGRTFAAKSQSHNAWFYLLQARDLATVVPFMSTRETDRLYDEAQKLITPDAPEGFPPEMLAAGKSYKIKNMFAYGVAGELNLVVKYDYADISDTVKVYAENQAVAHALVAKWPELRDGFGAIVARATDPSGKDFGTLVAMKDLK